MLIVYMRVSKSDGSQNLDLQRDALLDAGVEEHHIYEDQASGKNDERLGFIAACKALRAGDVLVTYKLDRLGRSLKHLVNTVHELTERGIGLRVLTGQGALSIQHRHQGSLFLEFSRLLQNSSENSYQSGQ